MLLEHCRHTRPHACSYIWWSDYRLAVVILKRLPSDCEVSRWCYCAKGPLLLFCCDHSDMNHVSTREIQSDLKNCMFAFHKTRKTAEQMWLFHVHRFLWISAWDGSFRAPKLRNQHSRSIHPLICPSVRPSTVSCSSPVHHTLALRHSLVNPACIQTWTHNLLAERWLSSPLPSSRLHRFTSIKTTITSWIIYATDMQKCIKLIAIIMILILLLVCERGEGEEHAGLVTWLTVRASDLRPFVPEPVVRQTSHLHPDEDGAAAL